MRVATAALHSVPQASWGWHWTQESFHWYPAKGALETQGTSTAAAESPTFLVRDIRDGKASLSLSFPSAPGGEGIATFFASGCTSPRKRYIQDGQITVA